MWVIRSCFESQKTLHQFDNELINSTEDRWGCLARNLSTSAERQVAWQSLMKLWVSSGYDLRWIEKSRGERLSRAVISKMSRRWGAIRISRPIYLNSAALLSHAGRHSRHHYIIFLIIIGFLSEVTHSLQGFFFFFSLQFAGVVRSGCVSHFLARLSWLCGFLFMSAIHLSLSLRRLLGIRLNASFRVSISTDSYWSFKWRHTREARPRNNHLKIAPPISRHTEMLAALV